MGSIPWEPHMDVEQSWPLGDVQETGEEDVPTSTSSKHKEWCNACSPDLWTVVGPFLCG